MEEKKFNLNSNNKHTYTQVCVDLRLLDRNLEGRFRGPFLKLPLNYKLYIEANRKLLNKWGTIILNVIN